MQVDEELALRGLQAFFQRRHPLAGERRVRAAIARAQIQGTDLRSGHVRNRALAVGHAVDRGIVHQDILPIPRLAHVDLYHVGLNGIAGPDRRDRHFRSAPFPTGAMGENDDVTAGFLGSQHMRVDRSGHGKADQRNAQFLHGKTRYESRLHEGRAFTQPVRPQRVMRRLPKK